MKKYCLLIVILVFPIMLWAAGQPDKPEEPEEPEAEEVESHELVDMIEKGEMAEIEKTLQLDVNVDYQNDKGLTALHVAAEMGHVQIVSDLINQDAKIDIVDKQGRTPLYLAVDREQVAVASILIAAGANPALQDANNVSPASLALEKSPRLLADLFGDNIESLNEPIVNDETFLHAAARKGLSSHVETLIRLGVSVDLHNEENQSPLDAALSGEGVTQKHIICAALLLQNNSPEPSDPEWLYITEPLRTEDYDIRFDYGSTAMHLATERGHEGVLKYLISQGASVDARDQPGNSPLHVAVRKGYLTIASTLITADSDVNARDYNGNAPIHEALSSPDGKSIIKKLIDHGADVNTKDSDGRTPLHLVVLLSADVPLAQMLIDNGAVIDARDRVGNTPLLLAIEARNRELSELFLDSGAKIFSKNNLGLTPALSALRNEEGAVVWFFNKARLFETDDEGRTVLHHALIDVTSLDNLSVLLEAGADSLLRDFNGETALHYAVKSQLVEHSLMLTENGGDLFIKNNAGLSPLILAFDKGPELTLNILVDNIDIRDRWGDTPLSHSVQWEYADIVQALLSKGADVNHKNKQGGTALHRAVVSVEGLGIPTMLIASGADPNSSDLMGRTPLHDSVAWNRVDMVKFLNANGISVDARDRSGQTALHIATFSGHDEICTWLLEFGASPNVPDNNGRTPLYIAAENSWIGTIELLISKGAYLESRDNEGRTALYVALRTGSEASAVSLIKNGADLFAKDVSGQTPFDLVIKSGVATASVIMIPKVMNIQDNQGNTPLHLAVMASADLNFVELLLDRGSDKNIRNSKGKTARDLALASKQDIFLSLLKQ